MILREKRLRTKLFPIENTFRICMAVRIYNRYLLSNNDNSKTFSDFSNNYRREYKKKKTHLKITRKR